MSNSSYAVSRQLLLPPPSSDGTVEIDLNRATNLPCAYTEFATCPVPPPGNVLGFEVVAGEQVPLLGPGSDA